MQEQQYWAELENYVERYCIGKQTTSQSRLESFSNPLSEEEETGGMLPVLEGMFDYIVRHLITLNRASRM